LLPLFPLGVVLFPSAALPLRVFEPRYRMLVDDLLAGPEPRSFGVVAIREGHEVGADAVRSLYDVGCVAVVRQLQRAPDGRAALVTTGGDRFRIVDVDRSRPYLQAAVDTLGEPTGDESALAAVAARACQSFSTYAAMLGRPAAADDLPADPVPLSYAIADAMAVERADRQALLEAPDAARRLQAEVDLLNREMALMQNLRTVPLASPPPPPRSSLN
jgi:Lon protease-like protein